MNKLKEGNYFFSARVGDSFSTAKIVSVRDRGNALLRSEMESGPLASNNLSVTLIGNRLYYMWNADDRNALIKIGFEQRPNKRR